MAGDLHVKAARAGGRQRIQVGADPAGERIVWREDGERWAVFLLAWTLGYLALVLAL